MLNIERAVSFYFLSEYVSILFTRLVCAFMLGGGNILVRTVFIINCIFFEFFDLDNTSKPLR